MDTNKIEELFSNLCQLKEKLETASTLTEEEEVFLQWLTKTLSVVEDNILSNFLILCKDYNQVCSNAKIKANGTLIDKLRNKEPQTIESREEGLAAGIAMAQAGMFDGLVGKADELGEGFIVEEAGDSEVYLSEEELGDLAVEMDF